MTLAEGAAICGVSEADLVKAAEWIAKPKDDGSRRKTVTAYEKGIIWGNDNYRTIGALVNIGLPPATSAAKAAGSAVWVGIRRATTAPPTPMSAARRPTSTSF